LRERVMLVGATRQMAPYYAAADVVAISSIKEGSPNVLLEAMAARVPVVATRVGGIPEIVTHQESALLVPPGNPTALADALAHVLSHPDEARALADRAHQVILDRHSPSTRARLLAGIYDSIIRVHLR
jgi:glycosyltransferase involved in cell wall biosynthesis